MLRTRLLPAFVALAFAACGQSDSALRVEVTLDDATPFATDCLRLSLLDADGNALDVLDGRMVGVSLDQLERIPTKLVVAGGAAKQRAVLAALRAGLVDILVTDAETARFALANA